jgi:hypothetical protein
MLRGVRSLTAPLLRAPADRPAWRKGLRAPLALVAVLGTFWAALNFRQFPEEILGIPHRPTIHFHLNGPAWVHPTFYVAFGALTLAALLLWVARTPIGLALGLVLLIGGLGAVIGVVLVRHNAGRIAGDKLFSLPMGTPRETVNQRLGWPAGVGHVRLHGQQLGCLVYVSTTAPWEGRQHVGFCFRAGRLVYRRVG